MQLDVMLIPLVVLIPAFAGLVMLSPSPAFDDRRTAWTFTLLASLVTFAISVFAAFRFFTAGPAVLDGTIPWVPGFGLNFGYRIDAISLWLMLLSTFLTPLIVLTAWDQGRSGPRQFYFWLLMVEAGMVGAFVASDLIFFFLCFEFTLVPLYFLIGLYGGRERITAARLFFVYTFAGSMLTFAGLMYVAWFAQQQNGVWSFDIATLQRAAQSMSSTQQGWVLASLLAGFAVKVPIFPLHTWLPVTYVEAPMAGTVVLSAVLAKLGTYALIRFAIPFCPDAVAAAAPLIGIFAVVSILYAALIAWVQRDMKRLVAYSSISHLGFCVLGLFALDPQRIGAVGGVLYMVNHGLATGALFLCVGMVYDRFGSTEISDVSGLARRMPVWAFFVVFFAMASIGLPGLNGFVSEFLTLLGAFISSDVLGPWYAAAAALGLILGAIYTLTMVGRVVFGPLKTLPIGRNVPDLTGREIAALLPIAAVCAFLGLYPYPVLKSLEAPVGDLVMAATGATTDDAAVAYAMPQTVDSPVALAEGIAEPAE